MLTSLRELFRRAEHADTDELTSLPNRRAFKEALTHEIQRAKRYGTPLSLTLFDLDHFKQVNDTLRPSRPETGFSSRRRTRCSSESLRGSDTLARVGGEEFAVLLPNTNEEGARRLRRAPAGGAAGDQPARSRAWTRRSPPASESSSSTATPTTQPGKL